jgi:hypothetical protein
MPKGFKTAFDKKGLASLAAGVGNDRSTIRYRCNAVAISPPLEDAGEIITRLPKAEYETVEWQPAVEALILVATLRGPTMFARIGVMRALMPPDLLGPTRYTRRIVNSGSISVTVRLPSGKWRW